MQGIFHQQPSNGWKSVIIGPLGEIPEEDIPKKKKQKKVKPGEESNINDEEIKKNDGQNNISSKMKTVLQVLSHGTSECRSPSILLQTSNGERHIFGRFGEGFQRIMSQNQVRFSKLQNVFISGQIDWTSVGGLPGIILTLADQGLSKLSIQSAIDNLPWACATWRNFIFRGSLDFTIKNANSEVYYDKFICVKGIPLYPENFTHDDYLSRLVDQDEVDRKSNDIFRKLFANTQNQGNNKKNSPQQKKRETGNNLTAASEISLPEIEIDPRASSYIIQIRPTRGKFLPKKAVELGVPHGVLFSKLTQGEAVTTEDGKVVYPDQVMEPPIVNGRVLIIDCPTNEYVKDVVQGHDWRESLLPKSSSDPTTSPESKRRKPSPEFSTPYTDSVEGYAEPVIAAFHILGETVNPFEGPYFDWMTDTSSNVFSPKCMHFITHPHYAPDGITLESAALLNLKLRKIFPENFKRLYTADPLKKFPSPEDNGYRVFPMITLGTVSVEPKVLYQSSLEKSGGKVDWAKCEEELQISTSDIEKERSKIPANIEDEVPAHLRDIEIVTLGTGSAVPNKYRNVVSTLVNMSKVHKRSILFDCGEATVGNMMRLYGPVGLKETISNVGVLYISHLHADHHLGAISFIDSWLKYTAEESPDRALYIMGPWKYFDFLSEWSQLEPQINLGRLRFVDNEAVIIGRGFREPTLTNDENDIPQRPIKAWLKELKEDLGLSVIRTCKAVHCDLAYCVSFKFNLNGAVQDKEEEESDGDNSDNDDNKQNQTSTTFQVAYSGDTRPTEFFAKKVGHKADLLIHEATHENGLEAEAFKKRHSTISEAIGIAKKMKAKYTVLTHFSQRYPKLPNMEGLEYSGNGNSNESRKDTVKDTDKDTKSDNNNSDGESGDNKGKLPNFALAFDGLHLKLSDIPKQKYMFSELTKLFHEVQELEDADENTTNESTNIKGGEKVKGSEKKE